MRSIKAGIERVRDIWVVQVKMPDDERGGPNYHMVVGPSVGEKNVVY
jgi:hypothetical protein